MNWASLGLIGRYKSRKERRDEDTLSPPTRTFLRKLETKWDILLRGKNEEDK